MVGYLKLRIIAVHKPDTCTLTFELSLIFDQSDYYKPIYIASKSLSSDVVL